MKTASERFRYPPKLGAPPSKWKLYKLPPRKSQIPAFPADSWHFLFVVDSFLFFQLICFSFALFFPFIPYHLHILISVVGFLKVLFPLDEQAVYAFWVIFKKPLLSLSVSVDFQSLPRVSHIQKETFLLFGKFFLIYENLSCVLKLFGCPVCCTARKGAQSAFCLTWATCTQLSQPASRWNFRFACFACFEKRQQKGGKTKGV